jgi:pilus assembly protein CpaC
MKITMHTQNRQPTSSRALGLKGLLPIAALALVSLTAAASQQAAAGAPTQVTAPAAQMAAPAQTAVPAEQVPAQTAQPAAPTTQADPAQNAAPQESQGPQMLHLLVGHSILITSPTRVKRVSIADPTIAEAIVVTPYQVQLNGKAPGGVSLIIWDESGQSQNFEVSVDIDILGITQKVHEVFPGEPVQIETSGNVVMLSGRVSSPDVADKILQVVQGVTPKVTNLMEVPAPATAQISLQVRFAEVNRVAITQLGANIIRDFGSNMPMSVSTGQFSPPGISATQSVATNGSTTTTTTSGNQFTLSNLLNVAIFRPDINLAVFIQALQEQNLLEILAEPNLLTESGKEASFLAGGQFPYPVPQSTGGNGYTTITIQFKEYGVRLNFTPTLMANGMIHLNVAPEVSTLDFTNALQLNGFLIPALAIDRVTSEMDLQDGQSFAIAGLLDNRVTKQFAKIPGIGDIPILGKLFQSESLTKSKNELLIIVTPHIVHAQNASEAPQGPSFPYPFLPATPGAGKIPEK